VDARAGLAMSEADETRIAMSAAEAWARRGERVAVAMVAGVRKSAPRPPGTKMAVSESGEIVGSVSGGCVEGAVIEVAEEIMRSGEPRLLHYGITNEEAWDVGLQCGGEIDVWIEPYRLAAGQDDASPDALTAAFVEFERTGGRGALVTAMRGPRAGAKMLVHADGASRGTLGEAELDRLAVAHGEQLMWEERSRLHDDAAGLFVDVTAPLPRLFVFGAVDYAATLCTAARLVGWRPFVADPRARFAQPARFPDAEAVVAAWPREAFERLGGIDRATAIVVLTHDPKLDDAALRAALHSDAGYIGAMGSRNAQRARRERLLEGGIDEAELQRIAAPVGLDLGALTAGETALSIMAEIVALRRGRSGGRLAGSAHRIHADAPDRAAQEVA
jgi:xanthine dehydrogenase accessory factor